MYHRDRFKLTRELLPLIARHVFRRNTVALILPAAAVQNIQFVSDRGLQRGLGEHDAIARSGLADRFSRASQRITGPVDGFARWPSRLRISDELAASRLGRRDLGRPLPMRPNRVRMIQPSALLIVETRTPCLDRGLVLDAEQGAISLLR